MEQLVLGIFQEHLAKVIVGFRKEQVNANLLNGKGEIRDVSLNCSVLNQAIARVNPYIELDEIHVSRLGFHVTSWTNLRMAPIIVDIGRITAKVQEPLHCLPKHQRKQLQMITESELIHQILTEGFKPLRSNGSYGLVDRIVDNMTIEMESFQLEYQTWGKFKTRRIGPWTPPLLQVQWKNLKIVMVDADGNEGSPDQVWAHNRHRRDSFFLYKKVYGECEVRLCSIQSSPKEEPDNKDITKDDGEKEGNDDDSTRKRSDSFLKLVEMKMEVQMAVQRRLRDGAVLAVQIDVTVPKVDVQVDSAGIHQLAHLSAGMEYCLSKDRSFDDPLKSKAESDNTDLRQAMSSSASPGPTVRTLSRGETGEFQDEDDENDGGDVQSDGDETEESLDIDDNDDDKSDDGEDDAASTSFDGTSTIDGGSVASWQDDEDMTKSSSHGATASIRRAGSGRPIVVLPNGLVVYKSISVTCSVHDFTFRGFYRGIDEGYLEFVAKGCIIEAIWPKMNNEHGHGMYAQLSTAFVSLQERYQQRKRTLLLGGMQRDDHLSLNLPSRKPIEIGADEFFPLFERRGIRDDPLDLRHLFPTQAFGLKTTIDLLKRPDNDGFVETSYKVLHEMGADEMDIVLDTDVVLRLINFILDEGGDGFDPRWHTGDWTDILTSDMLHHPSETLQLDDYLQQPILIFLDENSMISSDLFNVTARFTNINMRIPAAIHDNLRSCDIIFKWKETTLIVSSDLPRTFLSGKIGNSISGDARKDKDKGIIDFPNDPSDICYALEQREDQALLPAGSAEKTASTFRVQLTMRGFEINIVPIIPFCNASEARQLITVSNSSTIFCFEGEPPAEGSNQIKITVFLSILVHELILNVDFDLLAGATCTAFYHKLNAMAIADMVHFPPSPDSSMNSVQFESQDSLNLGRLKQSLEGRRIMVRRHISQSRETGGLAIVFCVQLNDVRIRVWRQNVSFNSPLRDGLTSHEDRKYHSEARRIAIVKVVDFELKGFEVGVEFDFHVSESRRTVLKCYLQSSNLRLCDLEKELRFKDVQEPGDTTNDLREWHLLELCSLGRDSLPSGLDLSGKAQQLAFRLEGQHKKGSQSWSMAVDITSPSIVNLHAEAVKNSALLIIEALLLPTWSKDPVASHEACPFPPGTLGSWFHSIAANFKGAKPSAPLDLRHLEIDEGSGDPIVERVLRTLCKLLLPSDLRVILLRCEIANFLISIPCDDEGTEEQAKNLSLLLNQSDVVTRFYPVAGSAPSDIEHVLACKGTDWSTLINTQKAGFYQSILTRQSLHTLFTADDSHSAVETLVHPFELNLTYSGAEMDISMKKGLLINDIRLIESFQTRLKSAIESSSRCISDIVLVVSAMKGRPVSETSELSKAFNDENVPHRSIPRRGEVSLTTTRHLLRKVKEEFGLSEGSRLNSARKRDDELESLKVAFFIKERERFGAVALMASRVAGWIRMGGQHRTGQRVARKSLVWPYWMVLRKSLLLLYPSPGVPTPSDLLSLENARIRQLSGGNSAQDVKRGFAIIEASGMTRYFVAGNAQEYNLWTREISVVIRQYSDPIFVSAFEESVRNSTSAEFVVNEAQGGNETQESSQRRLGLGNRLSSAFQSARQKSKDLSEKRGSASSDFDGHVGECGIVQSSNQESQLDKGSHTPRQSNAKGASPEIYESDTFSSDKPAVDASAARRVQFGKKLSGVGQVTKSRLGSALQTARQRGVDLSNRRRRNENEPDVSDKSDSIHSDTIESSKDIEESPFKSDPEIPNPSVPSLRRSLQLGSKLGSALQNARTKAREPLEKQGKLAGLRGKLSGWTQDHNDDIQNETAYASSSTMQSSDPGDSWICEACTFINRINVSVCDMCHSVRTTSLVPDLDHIQVETTADAVNELSASTVENLFPKTRANVDGPDRQEAFDGIPDSQSRQGQPGDNGNMRNSRFSFRKRQEGTTDDSVFGGDPMTLKNVHVSHRIPPSINTLDQVFVPLKMFEGTWIVTVEIGDLAESDPKISDPRGLKKRTDEKTTENRTVGAVDGSAVTDDATDFGPDAYGDANTAGYALQENTGPGCNEISGRPDGIKDCVESAPVIESAPRDRFTGNNCLFIVKVYRSDSITPDLASEQIWSYPDVLKLYAQVSGVVSSLLPQLVGNDFQQGSIEATTRRWKIPSADLIDNAVISGRILGGLLEKQFESTDSTGLRQYQREVIESYLNSLLKCALPIDALAYLSQALGICASTRDIDASEQLNSHPDVFSAETIETGERQNLMANCINKQSSTSSKTIFSLLAACETELQRAESTYQVLADIDKHAESKYVDMPLSITVKPIFYEPMVPPSLTTHLHDSMHEALMNAMAERDEAHAQLIGANVLHVHSLERERKKNDKLEIDMRIRQDIARIQMQQESQHPNIASFFGAKPDDRMEKMRTEIDQKIESLRRMININGDDELMQLCTQLAGEISAKTSNALEIERLKTLREAEKKTEAMEREACARELKRVKELLAQETNRSADATSEAAKWKSLYESQQNDASQK